MNNRKKNRWLISSLFFFKCHLFIHWFNGNVFSLTLLVWNLINYYTISTEIYAPYQYRLQAIKWRRKKILALQMATKRWTDTQNRLANNANNHKHNEICFTKDCTCARLKHAHIFPLDAVRIGLAVYANHEINIYRCCIESAPRWCWWWWWCTTKCSECKSSITRIWCRLLAVMYFSIKPQVQKSDTALSAMYYIFFFY